MRQLGQGWKPRISRRTRDRGVRVAAAALIAAALAETSGARPAAAAWTPGNPTVPGTYYADAPLDINGDGFTDFILHAGGYGYATLEPLTVDGVNNQIFITFPATATKPASLRYGRGGPVATGPSALSRPSPDGVYYPPVLPFMNPDDMLTAGAPTVSAPYHGDLYQFLFNRRFAGVIFHVPPPPPPARGTRAALSGADYYGYLEIAMGLPGVTIYSVGYQPLVTVAVQPGAPTALDLVLAPAAPNPVRLGARLAFTLPRAGSASLRLFDPQGRLVRNVSSGTFPAGAHRIEWDGRDDAGHVVPSGLYLLRLEADARRLTGKLVVSH